MSATSLPSVTPLAHLPLAHTPLAHPLPPTGTLLLFYPGYETLSALLYTIGSCGFLAVDGQELCTFDGKWLLTNISMSFVGSFLYVVGSVVRRERLVQLQGATAAQAGMAVVSRCLQTIV